MNKEIVASILFGSFFLSSQGQSLNRCDGPYVQYHHNEVVVCSIDSDNTARMDSFALSAKKTHPLSIHFSNHPDWDFHLTLRDSLVNEPCQWAAPAKILALSDIEGEFEAFRGLLLANQVIDSAYQWIFGRGNLVICGDLFDRGNDVTAELWLLYKLEDEARAEGGYVHTLLGNHDIMNLSGDLRYVQPHYFTRAKQLGLNYRELYTADTELGRWLRSKNIVEKIGDNLCLHGGISPQILSFQWPLADINTRCRPFYDQGMHPENFPDKQLWAFFDGHNSSPFWYRGYFLEPLATPGQVDSTLALYQCRRIIVGHTIVDTHIGSYYGGKLIGIDVDEHNGRSEGLWLEGEMPYRIDRSGKKQLLTPQNDPP